MKKQYYSSTIERALEVLNLFKEHDKLSFTKMQNLLGYNKSTLYRVITMLKDYNYLCQDINNRYKLGINIFILGNKFSEESQINNIITFFMKKITDETNLTTELGILEGKEIVVLNKIDPSNRMVKMSTRIGANLPAHCTGLGKALLAFSKKNKVENIINYHGLKRYTLNTICTADEFFQELKNIRERGYAINNAEQEKHIKNISVPLLNRKGKVLVALGLTGLSLDFEEEGAINRFSNLLIKESKKIKNKLDKLSI